MTDKITCPQCAMTSYNPNDIREKYCGNCHQYHDTMGGSGHGTAQGRTS